MTDGYEPTQGDHLGDASDEQPLIYVLWVSLLRRRFWILASVLITVVACYLWQRRLPSVYDSQATIRINQDSQSPFKDQAQALLTGGSDEDVAISSEITVLQTRALALRVASVLDLYNDTTFSTPGPKEGPPGPNNQQSVYRILYAFTKDLSVSKVLHTNEINITVRTRSPELSTRIARTLLNEYIARNYQARFESQQDVSDWLGKQLEDLRKSTEQAQARTLNLQKKLGLLGAVGSNTGTKSDTGGGQSLAEQRIEALETALANAQATRVLREAQYHVISGGDPEALTDSSSPVLADMRRQAAQLSIQIREMSEKFGPNYEPLRQLRAAQSEANQGVLRQQKLIVQQAKDELAKARGTEIALRSSIEQERHEAEGRNDDVVQYTIAHREFESNYELYQGLLARLKEAGILATLHSNNVDVIDPPMSPLVPSGPPRKLYLMGSVLGGLLLGSLLALLVESLDRSILGGDILEELTGLPTVGLIPKLNETKMTQASQDTDSIFLAEYSRVHGEAYRALRTSTLFSRSGSAPRVIVVTSSVPGEGKTTTTANLGWVFAQAEGRVLMIDCDLRRPGLSTMLRAKNKSGLCNILTGNEKLENVIHPVAGLPRLDFMSTGPLPPNPAELLSSHYFADLITNLSKEYDHIILDTPPTLSVSDALIVSRLADGVLFVVRSGKTARNLVQRACRSLRRGGVTMIGTVLNGLDFRSSEYGYYGYTDYYTQPRGKEGTKDDR